MSFFGGDRFIKASGAACRGAAPAAGTPGQRSVSQHIETEVNGGTRLSVQRMCELVQVSRAVELRDTMQKIALAWPAYGSRRITAELKRRGWEVNRKRRQRIMREDNLLCLRKRKFAVTTDSDHPLPVYPNLERSMVLTGVDQLWLADITYLRMLEEFIYLAVIRDAYSRRVIGGELDRTLEDTLTLSALRRALARRMITPGLVHHSDRGVQYASTDYTDLPKDHPIQSSIARQGNPWDNTACESFLKTLECEEVYRIEYRNLSHARSRIREFLEKVYNRKGRGY